tara:strand:- start:1608 stop:1859 length:252 start_codon:yes stop_codon:yes gene_type:complete
MSLMAEGTERTIIFHKVVTREAASTKGHTKRAVEKLFYGQKALEKRGKVVDLTGESSNTLFEILQDWEAQLKPHESQLPEMEP